jgi:hypothetical protein
MPKKSLPKKGTAEYAEQIADDPSDFIDEEDDNEPDKDGCKSEEEDDNDNEDDEDDDEAGVTTTKSALAAENKKLKAALEAALKAAPAVSPMGRVRYDHETTKKNLIKNTEPVRALMETLKDDYEAVYYMGSLCDYWKSRMTLDRTQNNEHVAFIKYFRKERHLYGLPAFVAATPSPKGSKTSSRAASVALDESISEEEA